MTCKTSWKITLSTLNNSETTEWFWNHRLVIWWNMVSRATHKIQTCVCFKLFWGNNYYKLSSFKHTHTNKQILGFFQYTYIPVKFVFAIWPRKHVLDCNKHGMQPIKILQVAHKPKLKSDKTCQLSIKQQTCQIEIPKIWVSNLVPPRKKTPSLAPEILQKRGNSEAKTSPHAEPPKYLCSWAIVGKDCVTAMEDKTRIRNAKKTAGKLQLCRKI